MKINFLGDSITAGAAASCAANNYVSLVGRLLSCEVNNFGVGGTRIAKQTVPSEYDEDFFTRAQRMGEADHVFVFGGTNDYGHGDAEMGKRGDTSLYTFYGAFENLVKYLAEKYGKERVTFILPIPRYNQDSIYGEGKKTVALYPLSDYINVEIELLKLHGVEYLDFSDMFPEPSTNLPTELFSDGLHPTDLGHRLIAERIAKYIKEKA